MQYISFPTSHTGVVSLASELAKEVIEEKKSFIKEKLAQALLTTKQKHINQKYLHLEGKHQRVALIRIKGLHPTKKGAKLHCAVI